MAEPQGSGQVDSRTGYEDFLIPDVRLFQSRRELDAGTLQAGRADCSNGHGLLVRGRADGDLVAHSKTMQIAGLDIGRAFGGIGSKVRALRRGTYMRHCDGLNSMAGTVDIETDPVADGDVGDRRHLQGGRSGRRVGHEVGLGAGFAHRGDGGDFISLHFDRYSGISRSVTKGDLLANHKAGRAHDGHVRGAGRDPDHRAIGQRLPHRCGVAGSRANGRNLSRLRA